MSHAAGKITVSGADAFHGTVHAAKSVHWAAQARGAARIFRHLHASIDENLPDGFLSPLRLLKVLHNLRSGGNSEGIDRHPLALEDAGKLQEITRLAASAGTD